MESLFELTAVTHYYGQVCALRDVSLTMAPGATGLIGQNGAGKSTLLQILLGLLQPTQGRVQVWGRPVRRAGIALRGRVGFMPERAAFVPGLKGVEYVALAGQLSGMSRRQAWRRAHETLSYLELEEARYRLLEQYSTGMKQRLKLAAALVHDPEVLLLDEPTAGLDPDGRAAMLDVLRALAARPHRSLLLSSHLLGDIERVCQTAIILNAGRVVGTGRIAELRTAAARGYRLRWEGDGRNFLAGLQAQGVEVRHAGRPSEARVLVPEGWRTASFFGVARQEQVLLNGLEPEEEDLEAVYQRLIRTASP